MPPQLTAAFARALQRTAAAPESIEFQRRTYDAQFTQLGAIARHYEGLAAQERRAAARYRDEVMALRAKIRELDPDYFRD
jgi:hypothetical protein